MIWFIGIATTGLAVAGLSMPWWWAAFMRRSALKRRTANVTAYRTRLQELESDVAAAVLPADAVEGVRAELASRLMQDADAPAATELHQTPSRAALLFAIVALAAFAATGYAISGTWRTQRLIELAKTEPELARAQALDDAIERLRERVAQQPDDAESWAFLGRSYVERGSYGDAAKAYARASELKAQQDPDLLVAEGEAVAFTQGRNMAGVPAQRFAQALALAPDHAHALWYAGIAALQAGDDRAAIEHWERLMKQPLPDEMRATLEHSLAQLRQRNGVPTPAPETARAASGLTLDISVSVAPALAAAVTPDETLFVYAQDPSGPPMPLAVRRLSAAQLPVQTTLDDSLSPMPTRKLSSIDRWRLVARISRSGSAIPQSGDLEGSLELDRGEAGKPQHIVIDRTH